MTEHDRIETAIADVDDLIRTELSRSRHVRLVGIRETLVSALRTATARDTGSEEGEERG